MINKLITAVITAKVIEKRIYGTEINPIWWVKLKVTEIEGDYPPLQKLITVRGVHEGEIIMILSTYDYSKADPKRKTKWRLASNRKITKKGQHISKAIPVSHNKAWVDFGTLDRLNDLGLIQFDESLDFDKISSMKIGIAENRRNDTGTIQMFAETGF